MAITFPRIKPASSYLRIYHGNDIRIINRSGKNVPGRLISELVNLARRINLLYKKADQSVAEYTYANCRRASRAFLFSAIRSLPDLRPAPAESRSIWQFLKENLRLPDQACQRLLKRLFVNYDQDSQALRDLELAVSLPEVDGLVQALTEEGLVDLGHEAKVRQEIKSLFGSVINGRIPIKNDPLFTSDHRVAMVRFDGFFAVVDPTAAQLKDYKPEFERTEVLVIMTEPSEAKAIEALRRVYGCEKWQMGFFHLMNW